MGKDMVNRNDKADLIKFFLVAGGIVFGIIVFIAYGFFALDGRYLKALDAKLDAYVQQQWNFGR